MFYVPVCGCAVVAVIALWLMVCFGPFVPSPTFHGDGQVHVSSLILQRDGAWGREGRGFAASLQCRHLVRERKLAL